MKELMEKLKALDKEKLNEYIELMCADETDF